MLASRIAHRFHTQSSAASPIGASDTANNVCISIGADDPIPELVTPLLEPPRMNGCDAAWRAYNHVCLQGALYTTAIVGAGAGTFGSILGLAQWCDTHERSCTFVETHGAEMVMTAMVSAALATAAGIAHAGHARLHGGRPFYYRLAPTSEPGAGSVVRASGLVGLACTAGTVIACFVGLRA